ncbi:hypothetical protein K402DRAFT_404828 [Aulographum hederae CBS 113979]|uniref:Uncharacterized protein n=1 Tax=Aulographum hederae CBS 113979 TaxID=1176131 RepID=A0A6G1GZ12_9PEZI|nr:hypothetical protein K402DRAFT_404828 [Aulographum hederae CBS 113979]
MSQEQHFENVRRHRAQVAWILETSHDTVAPAPAVAEEQFFIATASPRRDPSPPVFAGFPPPLPEAPSSGRATLHPAGTRSAGDPLAHLRPNLPRRPSPPLPRSLLAAPPTPRRGAEGSCPPRAVFPWHEHPSFGGRYSAGVGSAVPGSFASTAPARQKMPGSGRGADQSAGCGPERVSLPPVHCAYKNTSLISWKLSRRRRRGRGRRERGGGGEKGRRGEDRLGFGRSGAFGQAMKFPCPNLRSTALHS